MDYQLNFSSTSLLQIIGFLFLLYSAIILALLVSRYTVEKWIPRKIIHVVGLSSASLAVVLLTAEQFMVIVVIFVLTFLAMTAIPKLKLYQQLLRIAVREEESQLEGVLNSVLTIITGLVLYFLLQNNLEIFLSGILALTVGDGFAEITGRRWGYTYQYTIFSQKSLIGSFTVFLGTLASILFVYNAFGIAILPLIWIFLFTSFVSTIIEATSYSFLDNVFIPIGVALVLYLLI